MVVFKKLFAVIIPLIKIHCKNLTYNSAFLEFLSVNALELTSFSNKSFNMDIFAEG